MSEVGRGIYPFPARIRTPRGPVTTEKSKKLQKKVKNIKLTRDFELAIICLKAESHTPRPWISIDIRRLSCMISKMCSIFIFLRFQTFKNFKNEI